MKLRAGRAALRVSRNSSPRTASQARKPNEAGTTLIEALAALAITATLVAVFVPFTLQILDRWTAGQRLVDEADQVMRATVSLQREFAGAEPLPATAVDREEPSVFFRGDASTVIFARAASDLRSGTRLETIAFTIETGSQGTSLVRRTASYDASQIGADPHQFANPTTVLAGPLRMSFAFVSRSGRQFSSWSKSQSLPERVELTLLPPGADYPATAPIVLNIVTDAKQT